MTDVEIVELRADGVCPRCGANYGPEQSPAEHALGELVQASEALLIAVGNPNTKEGLAIKERLFAAKKLLPAYGGHTK